MTRYKATSEGMIPFTPEEEAEWDAMKAEWEAGESERKAAQARSERNRLLSESDWTQVLDASVDRDDWATYRQALRDIPQQAGFPITINWPVKPE